MFNDVVGQGGDSAAIRILGDHLGQAQERAVTVERRVPDLIGQLATANARGGDYDRGYVQSANDLINTLHTNYDRFRLPRRVVGTRHDLVTAIGALVDTQTRYEVARADLAAARATVNTMTTTLESRDAALADLANEVTELVTRSAGLATAAANAGDNATIVAERDAAVQRAEAAEERVRQLQAQLSTANTDLVVTTAARDTANQRLEEAQGQVNAVTTQYGV